MAAMRFETAFKIELEDPGKWAGWFNFGPSMDSFDCHGEVLPAEGRHEGACFRLVAEFSQSPVSVDPVDSNRHTSFGCAITADYYEALHLSSLDDGSVVIQCLSIPEPFMPDGFDPDDDWFATVEFRYEPALTLGHQLSRERLEYTLEHGPGAAPQREVETESVSSFDNGMTVDYGGRVSSGADELSLPYEVDVAYEIPGGLVVLLDAHSEGATEADIDVPPSRNILLVSDECDCRWLADPHPDGDPYDLLWLVDGVPHTEVGFQEFRPLDLATGTVGSPVGE